MKKVLVMMIRGYQILISPLLGNRCRFLPSCSHYAMEAITTQGSLKGLYLATKRICKCHPFHPGGYDPVPGTEPKGERFPTETKETSEQENRING